MNEDLLKELDELASRIEALHEALQEKATEWGEFCSANNLPWSDYSFPTKSDDFYWMGDDTLYFQGTEYSGDRFYFNLPRLWLTDPDVWLAGALKAKQDKERKTQEEHEKELRAQLAHIQRQLGET